MEVVNNKIHVANNKKDEIYIWKTRWENDPENEDDERRAKVCSRDRQKRDEINDYLISNLILVVRPTYNGNNLWRRKKRVLDKGVL